MPIKIIRLITNHKAFPKAHFFLFAFSQMSRERGSGEISPPAYNLLKKKTGRHERPALIVCLWFQSYALVSYTFFTDNLSLPTQNRLLWHFEFEP